MIFESPNVSLGVAKILSHSYSSRLEIGQTGSTKDVAYHLNKRFIYLTINIQEIHTEILVTSKLSI